MNADNPIALAEWLMQTMREYFERDGHLDPVAVVLATKDFETGEPLRDPEPVVLPLQFADDAAKQEAAELVRDAVRKTEACMVICGFEMWVVRSDDEKEIERAMEVGPKNCPNREEVLYCSLEHRAGELVWIADIKRDASQRPSLASFALDEGVRCEKFTGFLPQETTPRFDA